MPTPSKHTNQLFRRRWFDEEIVTTCVRWYLSFPLSYRDLVRMMGERGVRVSHTTIMRWIIRYASEFERRWRRFGRRPRASWRVDETYLKVEGDWMYYYRAVDQNGETVDSYLGKNRNVKAAKAFFRKAFKSAGEPVAITLDAYAANHRALAELKASSELYERVRVRSCKYVNNIIEQDHRRIKRRVGPMQSFKRFDHAVVVLSGIELVERLKKGQYRTDRLAANGATAPELWQRALAA